MRDFSVTYLSGGWLLVQGAMPGDLYVRVLPDDTKRLRVREMYLDGPEPITADILRALPLGDIEGMANLEADLVLAQLREPGGDRLGILASHIGYVPGGPDHEARMRARHRVDGQQVERTWMDLAAEDWVVGSYLASFHEDVRAANGLGALRPPTKRKRRKPRGFADIDYRLKPEDMPSRGRLDDAFMRQLARAYTAAVARGESPNVTIAHDIGYPIGPGENGKPVQHGVRTVQSWVYQARKRGYLPPARKGAAG